MAVDAHTQLSHITVDPAANVAFAAGIAVAARSLCVCLWYSGIWSEEDSRKCHLFKSTVLGSDFGRFNAISGKLISILVFVFRMKRLPAIIIL